MIADASTNLRMPTTRDTVAEPQSQDMKQDLHKTENLVLEEGAAAACNLVFCSLGFYIPPITASFRVSHDKYTCDYCR